MSDPLPNPFHPGVEVCVNLGFVTTNCPELAPAVLFVFLYGLTALGHIYQAWRYKKIFCWILIMGNLWEFVGMATRIVNIQHKNENVDHVSVIFILLAPLWINAFAYMVLGKLVYMYMPDKRLARMKAQKLGWYFVGMDITCFIVQLIGVVMIVHSSKTPESLNRGAHIYTAGTCLQETVILVFFGLAIQFSRRLKREDTGKDIAPAKRSTFALYTVLGLIAFRVLFRILEFASPHDSKMTRTINTNEYFMYVFDITPMFLALLTLNIFHPGRTLQGPDSQYPKLTRQEKIELKEQKKRDKKEKHARTESSTEMV